MGAVVQTARLRAAARSITTALRNPQARAPWFFIAVPTLIIMVFHALPAVVSLVLSLYDYDGVSTINYYGARNYGKMLDDPLFVNGILVTAYYTIGSVVPTLLLSLLVAVVLNSAWFPAKSAFRAAYFMPTVVSLVAIALVWQWLLHPNFGLVNDLLRVVGVPPQQFLGNPLLAMPTLIAISVWRGIGYDAVIFLAGLQGISQTYYEAAEIDGASRWALFRYITWPLLMPTTLFVLVIGVIRGFQVFDLVYVMTGGGPVNATRVIVWYIWHRAFQTLDMGYASAMAVVLFLIILFFTLLQFRLVGRHAEY